MLAEIFDDARRFIIPRRKFGSSFSYFICNLVLLFFQEGFVAILFFRFAHMLARAGCFPVAFVISKIALFITGIYINPDTSIGKGCKLNHAGSTIRAESIGEHAEITGNVTIGELRPLDDHCPDIGHHVYIGAGAKIFANLGNHVIVGANAVVTRDVPDNCVVCGVPAQIVKETPDVTENP